VSARVRFAAVLAPQKVKLKKAMVLVGLDGGGDPAPDAEFTAALAPEPWLLPADLAAQGPDANAAPLSPEEVRGGALRQPPAAPEEAKAGSSGGSSRIGGSGGRATREALEAEAEAKAAVAGMAKVQAEAEALLSQAEGILRC